MRSRLLPLLTSLGLALGALAGLSLTTATPATAAAAVFPVPTAEAGLARIVTAPSGVMWFVEKDAQKIGRVTPQGGVSEVDLSVNSDVAQVKDLDVAPDGTLWVLVDSGRYAAHLSADASSVISLRSLGSYPYGEQVRVAPNGVAWVTMSYDQQFAVTVTDSAVTRVSNAPCQGPLGEAADGSMWCSNNGSLFHLPGTGGIPVGVYASWPRAMTAGPVGDIWFATHQSGSYAFSPSAGYVGYLAGANPVRFNVGDRVAPNDLVRGPDNAMWFTSVGAAKGIGHVDANGRGSVTQVGGYEPESLTFGPDGAVWFTDETNNVIVRVPTSELQVTNVDPGAGSVLSAASGANPAANLPVRVKNKTSRVRAGRVPLTLTCPKGTAGGCKGKVSLVTAKAVRKPGAGKKKPAKVLKLTGAVTFKLKAGKKAVVRPRLTATGSRLVRGKAVKAVVVVRGVTIGTVKVRR